jgi:hypothetical protein
VTCDDPAIVLVKPLPFPYEERTALFSVGLSYRCYAALAFSDLSRFDAPNMESIPVRIARIAGLQGE